jgi:hypothetical protein
LVLGSNVLVFSLKGWHSIARALPSLCYASFFGNRRDIIIRRTCVGLSLRYR